MCAQAGWRWLTAVAPVGVSLHLLRLLSYVYTGWHLFMLMMGAGLSSKDKVSEDWGKVTVKAKVTVKLEGRGLVVLSVESESARKFLNGA